jgi:hypothetical protein
VEQHNSSAMALLFKQPAVQSLGPRAIAGLLQTAIQYKNVPAVLQLSKLKSAHDINTAYLSYLLGEAMSLGHEGAVHSLSLLQGHQTGEWKTLLVAVKRWQQVHQLQDGNDADEAMSSCCWTAVHSFHDARPRVPMSYAALTPCAIRVTSYTPCAIPHAPWKDCAFCIRPPAATLPTPPTHPPVPLHPPPPSYT